MASILQKTGLAGLALAFAIASLATGAARAGDDEFYVNTFRSVGTVSPKGSRSTAMGGSGRGLADGVASLGTNPAALGAFQGAGYDIGLGYDWLDDGYDDADQLTFRLGGAVNINRICPTDGPNQAIGALLNIQSYSGAANVEMKREQTGVLMGYGLQLSDNLLGGVSVALFDGKWSSDPQSPTDTLYLDRKFTGGDFKLGALYRWCDETTVGGTLEYATGSWREKGGYAAGAGSGDLDRFGIGVGIAHQYAENTLILGDLWYDRVKAKTPGILSEDDKSWGLSVGVEQQLIPELLALRGGLYYDHTSYSSSGASQLVGGGSYSKGRYGITAGAGIKLYSFELGYSLDVNSGGDVKNLLDLSAEW